jgi:tetratricopeptide (TPR) repeat protein
VAARRALVAAGLAAALALSCPARAQHKFTDQEIAMLPEYCITHPYIQLKGGSSNPAASERWKTVIGPHPYAALHHYCWAQALTIRAKFFARTKQERYGALSMSIGDFDYVLNHVGGRYFILLPEILHKKGENLMELGQIGEAVSSFQQAMIAKPDYWPPYAAMSDHYKKTGDLEKAREWLAKALAIDPQHKALLLRQAELGGAKVKPSAAEAPAGAKPKAGTPKEAPKEQAPPSLSAEPPQPEK